MFLTPTSLFLAQTSPVASMFPMLLKPTMPYFKVFNNNYFRGFLAVSQGLLRAEREPAVYLLAEQGELFI